MGAKKHQIHIYANSQTNTLLSQNIRTILDEKFKMTRVEILPASIWTSLFKLLKLKAFKLPVVTFDQQIIFAGQIPDETQLQVALHHQLFKKHATDYSQITDQIFIGTNLCCVTHAHPVIAEKFMIEIDLEEDHEVPNQKLLNPLIYLHLPTKDHTAPRDDQLLAGIDLITHAVKSKQKVYVHCREGHGRSPTLVIAYFMSLGMNFKTACQKVSNKRPEMHLTEIQIKSLKSLNKKRFKKP